MHRLDKSPYKIMVVYILIWYTEINEKDNKFINKGDPPMDRLQDKKAMKREFLLGSISVLILILLFSLVGWSRTGVVGLISVIIRLVYVYNHM